MRQIRLLLEAIEAEIDTDVDEKAADVEAMLGACAEALKDAGLPIGQRLGCGYYGCGYLGKQNQVVKIALLDGAGEKEMNLSLLIRDGKVKSKHLPKIDDVFTLTGPCLEGKTFYAIQREDLSDMKIGKTSVSIFKNLMKNARLIFSDKISKEEFVKIMTDGAKKGPSDADLELLDKLYDAISDVAGQGIEIDDLKYQNWAQRDDGTLVIRDYGNNTAPSGSGKPTPVSVETPKDALGERGRSKLSASDVSAAYYQDEFQKTRNALQKDVEALVAKKGDKLPPADDVKAVRKLLEPLVENQVTRTEPLEGAEIEFQDSEVTKDAVYYSWLVSGNVEASRQLDVDDFDEATFRASGTITIGLDKDWADVGVEADFDRGSIDMGDHGPDDY